MLLGGHSFAQSNTYPLRMEKKKVYQNDVLLKYKEVKTIVMNNSLSSAEFKTHQVTQAVGTSLLLVGSCLTAYGAYLGLQEAKKANDELDKGNLNYQQDYSKELTVLGAAVACMVVSIPFSVKAKRSFKKSIDLYNSGISETGSNSIDFRMHLSYNQVGVTMRF